MSFFLQSSKTNFTYMCTLVLVGKLIGNPWNNANKFQKLFMSLGINARMHMKVDLITGTNIGIKKFQRCVKHC